MSSELQIDVNFLLLDLPLRVRPRSWHVSVYQLGKIHIQCHHRNRKCFSS